MIVDVRKLEGQCLEIIFLNIHTHRKQEREKTQKSYLLLIRKGCSKGNCAHAQYWCRWVARKSLLAGLKWSAHAGPWQICHSDLDAAMESLHPPSRSLSPSFFIFSVLFVRQITRGRGALVWRSIHGGDFGVRTLLEGSRWEGKQFEVCNQYSHAEWKVLWTEKTIR